MRNDEDLDGFWDNIRARINHGKGQQEITAIEYAIEHTSILKDETFSEHLQRFESHLIDFLSREKINEQ